MRADHDDVTLRRYVLGELAEETRVHLEEALVVDQQLFERLAPVEDELMEEYIEGTLSAGERLYFETHFLAPLDHRRRLALLRLLKERASQARAVGAAAAFPPATSQAGLGSRFWLALAAGTILLVAGNLWLGVRGLRFQEEIDQLRAAKREADQEREESRGRLEGLAAELHRLRVQVESRATGAGAASVPIFRLAAQLLRGPGSLPRIAVPVGAEAVRLDLEVPVDPRARYRVAIVDVEGGEIWAQSRLAPGPGDGPRQISVLLPARMLVRGDYQARVTVEAESGPGEPIATFSFRVTSR